MCTVVIAEHSGKNLKMSNLCRIANACKEILYYDRTTLHVFVVGLHSSVDWRPNRKEDKHTSLLGSRHPTCTEGAKSNF